MVFFLPRRIFVLCYKLPLSYSLLLEGDKRCIVRTVAALRLVCCRVAFDSQFAHLGTPFPHYAFSFFDRMFPLLPPCCCLLSFIVLFVPSPRTLSLHSVGYRFASVCKFAHLGMTPLSIFDCPLLVPPFNSLLINSLSLFVLHYPLYRSFLSHPYSANGRCEIYLPASTI